MKGDATTHTTNAKYRAGYEQIDWNPTDMICEAHPEREWPHGRCPGPGMPKPVHDAP